MSVQVDEAQRPKFKFLRAVSFAEGATLLFLLCVGLQLKHFYGIATVVHILGPLHGITVGLG